jgi:hypothetical protein
MNKEGLVNYLMGVIQGSESMYNIVKQSPYLYPTDFYQKMLEDIFKEYHSFKTKYNNE